MLVDLAKELVLEASGGCSLQVFIPREAIEDLLSHPISMHMLRLRGAVGGLLVDHLRAFVDRLGAMASDEAAQVAVSSLHLLAAAAQCAPAPHDGANRSCESNLLRQACRYVELHLKDDGLSATSLCQALRISRSTLYRLFERFGGVGQYIRERRLVSIHAILSSPQRRGPLGVLADEYGFKSGAQFSTAFRKQFGCAPRDVANASPVAVVSAAKPIVDGDLSSWLMSLRG